MNREDWLTEVGKRIETYFKGFKIDPYRLTCGWPSKAAMGKRGRRVGECHSPKSSGAGVYEIFISPVLDKPLEVAGTVCHEMAHVAAGIDAAHGKGFIKVCRHVGLTRGKPSQIMPGDRLEESLSKIIEKLGNYPHKAMKGTAKEVHRAPTMIRVECECGCVAMVGMKWIATVGPPTCGCGKPMEVADA